MDYKLAPHSRLSATADLAADLDRHRDLWRFGHRRRGCLGRCGPQRDGSHGYRDPAQRRRALQFSGDQSHVGDESRRVRTWTNVAIHDISSVGVAAPPPTGTVRCRPPPWSSCRGRHGFCRWPARQPCSITAAHGGACATNSSASKWIRSTALKLANCKSRSSSGCSCWPRCCAASVRAWLPWRQRWVTLQRLA